MKDSLKKLGCVERVKIKHLWDYVEWISEKFESSNTIGFSERKGIIQAYSKLGRFDEAEIDSESKIFLSISGKLFSKNEVNEGKLIFDDLGIAIDLIKEGLQIEVADYGKNSRGRDFFESGGIKPLSNLIKMDIVETIGRKSKHPLSDRIRSSLFRKALLGLNKHAPEYKNRLSSDKINAIKKVNIYGKISIVYRLKSKTAKLSREVGIKKRENGYEICCSQSAKVTDLAKEISHFIIVEDKENKDLALEVLMILLESSGDTISDWLLKKNITLPRSIQDYSPKLEDEGKEAFTSGRLPTSQDGSSIISDQDESEDSRAFINDLIEIEEELERLKELKGSTAGIEDYTVFQKRPSNVTELQEKIRKFYTKCQICGQPTFEGFRKKVVYGHLRGHHLIPWQEKETTFNGLLCLCHTHHHKFHHAKSIVLKISKKKRSIKLFVNGKEEGEIYIKKGHEILDYILINKQSVEKHNKNTLIEEVDLEHIEEIEDFYSNTAEH